MQLTTQSCEIIASQINILFEYTCARVDSSSLPPCLHTYFVHHTFVIVMLIYFVILYFYFPICRCCMHEWEHNIFFVYIASRRQPHSGHERYFSFSPAKKRQQQLNTTMKCWLGRENFICSTGIFAGIKKNLNLVYFILMSWGWCVTEKYFF